MKIKEIQTIIKDFEKSELTKLEIETEEFKIKLSKQKNEDVHLVDQKKENTNNTQVIASGPQETDFVAVKSPLVGTFYVSSSPTSKPYVQKGSVVKKGDVICLIEAMKIMNEITAPVDGVILAVEANNKDFVGFDQVLFKIGPVHDQ